MTRRLAELADTEERREVVRAAAAEFLRGEWSLARLRARLERGDEAWAPELWKGMQQLDWDAALSDSALDPDAFCALVEETGRSLAPTPLSSCVAARSLLRAAGADGRAALPVLAHGEAERSSDPLRTSLRSSRTKGGYRLQGSKRFVPYGRQADRVIANSVEEDGGFGLYAIDGASKGLECSPLRLVDGSPCAELRFDGVELRESARLASGDAARALLADALALETLARCAELVGVAARALDLAVDYAKQRVAFDRPIGSFQAVQHKLVDCRGRIEITRALVQNAAGSIGAAPRERDSAVAMAAFAALDGLRTVPEAALQIFGGIGTTWEHDVHFFVRRAATLCSLIGERSGFREAVARVLIPDEQVR